MASVVFGITSPERLLIRGEPWLKNFSHPMGVLLDGGVTIVRYLVT